jgi:hypothetical protein
MARQTGIIRILVLMSGFFIVAVPEPAFSDGLADRDSVHRRALEFLKEVPREWSGTSAKDCKTYEPKNIDRLSRPFAAATANFLRAFVEIHGHVTLTSAHRTAPEQACVCVGEKGPCAGRRRILKSKKGRRIVKRGGISHHQLGIAIDVRAGTGSDDEFKCLHEFAALNPQFGIRFPFGKRDRPHMEPAIGNHMNVKLASLEAVRSAVTPCTSMRIMLTHGPVD